MPMSEIFIATSSIDEATYKPVAEKLASMGCEPIVYLADKVVSGDHNMALLPTREGELLLSYQDKSFNLASFSGAWCRHPKRLGLDYEDRAKQMCMEQEIIALQDSLLQGVPENIWLNSPYRMERAQAKLAQLAIANSIGFATPRTIVSNSWDEINDMLPDEEIIVKVTKGLLYDGNETNVLYTTKIDAKMRQKLSGASPLPGIYQNYKSKAREWRITVVDNDVFSVAIYTDEDAKIDWRRQQLTDKVRFREEAVDASIGEKCIELLGHYRLRYGAFDFIEDNSGKITYLECNPNGQYMWLEQLLDIPISDAIAHSLATTPQQASS